MAFRRPVARRSPPRGIWPTSPGTGTARSWSEAIPKAAIWRCMRPQNAPAAVQERLIAVFCHDGPGFDADFFDTPGYARVAPLVDKSVPESSIVGMLFEMREHVEDGYTIVSSDGASIMQHFRVELAGRARRVSCTPAACPRAPGIWRVRSTGGMAKFDDEHRRRFNREPVRRPRGRRV